MGFLAPKGLEMDPLRAMLRTRRLEWDFGPGILGSSAELGAEAGILTDQVKCSRHLYHGSKTRHWRGLRSSMLPLPNCESFILLLDRKNKAHSLPNNSKS